jgi:hypothetical protein
MTNPEVSTFINSYIKGIDVLPVQGLFDKIGIDYDAFSFKPTVKSAMNAQQAFFFDQWRRNLD